MYTRLSSLPLPTAAHFPSPSSLRIAFSIRDHVRNLKRNVTKTVTFPSLVSTVYEDAPADVVLSLVSPSAALRAVLRDTTNAGGSARFVEIWSNDHLMACEIVSSLHGRFYTDEFISTIAFSPSETALVYMAEQNEPSPDDDRFAKFRFSPSFGEGLPKSRRPRIFIFRWQGSESVSALSIPSESAVHFGQAVFHTETELYATAFELTPDARLLGIKYCTNRPLSIFRLTITGTTDAGEHLATASRLTPPHLACRSPRIFTSSAGTFLTYLSCNIGGPHSAANSLHLIDLANPQPKTLVPIVDEPDSATSFPGLYPPYNLPTSCIVNHASWNAPKMVTHSIWGSRSTVILIDAHNGDITHLTPPDDDDDSHWNWQVLTTDEDARIVCIRSSPSVPHQVVLGTLSATTLSVPQWLVVHEPTLSDELKASLSSINTEIIPIPGRSPVETLVLSTPSKNGACILAPHGGPHTTSTTEFNPLHAAFALEGYTLALPNYTGSLGFGQSSVLRLIGQCGSLDVQDCMHSLSHLVALNHAQRGRGKVFIFGGSHGGFLGAHLVGQFPDVFSAAVLRNPVISVGQMGASDIPDWAYAEFDVPFPTSTTTTTTHQGKEEEEEEGRPLAGMTPQVYQKLYAASPIRFAHQVTADVLLLMGKDDLRVPPTQGYGYYHALKALRRGRVEMLVFDGESHSLDGVECARVNWEATIDWFARSTS